MSRIGKKPIELPKGVEVKQVGDVVSVKGPKGTLTTPIVTASASASRTTSSPSPARTKRIRPAPITD